MNCYHCENKVTGLQKLHYLLGTYLCKKCSQQFNAVFKLMDIEEELQKNGFKIYPIGKTLLKSLTHEN